jgi:HEPN domain-containing protein
VSRKELQLLSRIRLREARALAKLGMSDGAYYLAGYAVECALKACIAKGTQRHEFPDKEKAVASYSHAFGKLLNVAGLERSQRLEAQHDSTFRTNWDIVQLWSPHRRYLITDATDAATTNELIEAVGDRNHGVVRWIKLHW